MGGVSAVAAAYELLRQPGAGAPAASPAPTGATLVAIASASPPAAPTASAQPAGPRQHFHSRPDLTPPAILPSVAAARRVAPGYVFLTPSNGDGQDGPMIADNAGNLVWLRPDAGIRAVDFRASTFQDKPVLTWWEGSLNGGIGSGEYVIADQSYRVIARIRAGNGRQADLHELVLTPDGTALLFADAGVPALIGQGATPAPWQVLDCAVQEIDVTTGRVLFEWHSVEHIDVAETYLPAPTKAGQIYDYVHANSIEAAPDGSLLVSARNTSAIYKIDRASGDIVWRLGGRRSDFTLGPGATFGWQHDARWQPDGTLTMFDDQAAPGHSRGLVLSLDESAMTATVVRSYAHPPDLLATSQGNLQVLTNGNVFIGWGSQPFFSEFSRDGELLFDATFPAGGQSYRDVRARWEGHPVDPPDVAVANAGPGSLAVYASWNGATNVARWDVLGGPSADRLERIGSGAATGFETAITVESRAAYVAVRAYDAHDQVLGTSRPAATA